ncbi:MAG: porin family protein [Cardiobacteriaceae bacterium]|nr:porin family protein [Cardiobacteriaceae bacterium]
MINWRILLAGVLAVAGFSEAAFAQSAPAQIAQNRIDETLNKPEVVVPSLNNDQQKIRKDLSVSLPSEAAPEEEKITFTAEYLQQHPQELESLLQELIRQNNTEGLKLLLPIYATVPNRDPSLIDWGNALIALEEGNTKEAVSIYRKMIAALPEHKLLRFQLAVALYRNGELTAARDQFEKLRSIENLSQADIALMDKYIASIDQRNAWSFRGSLSYLDNQNINNAPPAGTTLKIGNSTLSSREGPKSGRGFSYSFGGDKKWSFNSNNYASFDFNISGEHYFNANRYDNLSLRIAPGIGYQTPRFNFEVSPFLQKQWYGGGSSGKGHLASYVTTPGIRVEGSYWISPRVKYQGALQYGKDNYVATYNQHDGNNILLSNTLLFAQNQNRLFFGGLDANFKRALSDDLAYDRYGVRLGWNEEWSKGISTRVNLGAAKRFYKGNDFFGIKRTNNEYNASLTVWHRGIHFYGITPRIVWSYNKTDSNHPFYNYDNHKIFFDFSKTF